MQEAQGALSFTELILNASLLVQLVMAFLLVLSLVSWTIIIQRSNQYKIGRKKADEFEDRFWSGIDLNNLYQDCIKRQDELVGLEVIYAAGFKEFVRLVNSGPADQDVVMDGTYRQMKVASSREVEALESHLPTLATIGSISPYIGLFGTVWGIMHAFVALAAVKNATLSMVAPPIAEALIATAMGLFAAIPAVMFYNRFVTKVEALENRYLNFMDEFSTILNRRLVTIRTQLLKQERTQSMQDNTQVNAQNMQRGANPQYASYAQSQQSVMSTQQRQASTVDQVQAQNQLNSNQTHGQANYRVNQAIYSQMQGRSQGNTLQNSNVQDMQRSQGTTFVNHNINVEQGLTQTQSSVNYARDIHNHPLYNEQSKDNFALKNESNTVRADFQSGHVQSSASQYRATPAKDTYGSAKFGSDINREYAPRQKSDGPHYISPGSRNNNLR